MTRDVEPSAPELRSDADVLHFYAHAGGSRMLAQAHHTPAVRAYLEREAEPLLDEPGFEHLFEVGCGQGRHLDWARGHELHYDGLDLVPGLIEQGRARARALTPSPRRCELHVGSAAALHELWLACGLDSRAASVIVLLPFNCFGCLARPELVAAAVAATGARVFLSMFDVSAAATRHRHEYYTKLGFAEVRSRRTDRGVLFTSTEGLWSYAYDRGFLAHVLGNVGLVPLRELELGDIARGHLFGPPGSPRGTP